MCVEHEISMILEEAHDGIAGGHYAGKVTAKNILCAGIWWPTLHKYAKEYYSHAMYVKEWEIHLGGMKFL
jgi:hypothetical protein